MCQRGLEQQLLRESGSVMRTRFCVWTVIISYRADTEDEIGNRCTGWSTVNEVEFVVNRIVCFSKPFFIGMTVLVQNIIQITHFVRINLKVQICFSRQYSTLFETEKKNYTSGGRNSVSIASEQARSSKLQKKNITSSTRMEIGKTSIVQHLSKKRFNLSIRVFESAAWKIR